MSATEKPLPKIGAALMLRELPQFAEWLITDQRDLEVQDGFLPNLHETDWQRDVKEAQSVLAGYTGRLGIHGPFIDLTLAAKDPWIRDYVTKRLLQTLDFAEALGGTHMVVHSPFEYFGATHAVNARPGKLDQVIKLTHATLKTVLPRAEAIGCTLVIETIRDKNVEPLLALIRSFESDFVRLSIDTGHCLIQHLQGGATPDTWVDASGDLLAHVHVQDTDGLADRHWAPGNGAINWYAFFRALSQLEHTPRLVLELKDKAWIERGFSWLVKQGLVQ